MRKQFAELFFLLILQKSHIKNKKVAKAFGSLAIIHYLCTRLKIKAYSHGGRSSVG